MIENIILLINALPLPVFIQDVSGIYIECNDRFANYLDKTKPEILGKTIFEITHNKEFAESLININEQLIQKSIHSEGQYSWAGNTLTNTFKSFIVNKSLLKNSEGIVYGIIGTITDTTNIDSFKSDLKRTHNVITEKGYNNDVLRLLNHEFRTPMNAINGLTNLLHQKEDNSEKKELLSSIKHSNERLLRLIINILQLAEIESDEFYLNIENININGLVEESILSYKKKACEKNINILFENNHNITDNVYTSKFALTVIISNLLSNAIKYSEKGSIKIEIKKIFENNGNALIELMVKDEGIGIPQDKMNTIFDKYTQIDNLDKEPNTGVGLGLNIVKQIVEAMDGEINVESDLGKGSKFIVTFPVSI